MMQIDVTKSMADNARLDELLRAVDAADSAKGVWEAMRDLAEARIDGAVPMLISALSYNNPGAAVAAVDGLVALGEISVAPLLEQIHNHNYTARAWAIRALAGIGDPRGLETLLHAAQTDFSMSVRRAATRGLGIIRWQEIPADQVQAAQAQAFNVLLEVTEDDEWVVRYAAVVGLHAFAAKVMEPEWRSQIRSVFSQMATNDNSLSVRSRVWFAQQQLGNL